jgi:hypothetical protein
MSDRHDFTQRTKEILAKRVRYSCSNPICGKSTIGPHSEKEKTLLIGIAAHITAASPGGPRYDNSLREDERRSLDNAVWLCVNCSTLIDKDQSSYTVEILKRWRIDAEQKTLLELIGETKTQSYAPKPILEVDLIPKNWGRSFIGYADENFKPGEERLIIAGQNYIAFYNLEWRYRFIIMNNSSVPAFNVSVNQIDGYSRLELGKLDKTNNIPPYQSKVINMKLEDFFKGYHFDADILTSKDIPPILNDVKFEIKYFDEARNEYKTILDFSSGEITQTFTN